MRDEEPERWIDHDKREAALVFERWWELVEADETYVDQRGGWRDRTANRV